MKQAPHVIPYQGSKRKLAKDIISYMDFNIETVYEPFVGSGAITLAAATNSKAKNFVIADKLEPLANLWNMIIESPMQLASEYSHYWTAQLDDPASYFKKMREEYNKSRSPSILLYLIARCVKNAVRFNSSGDFNQSPDNRRLGMKPEKVQKEAILISKLLRGKTTVQACDFRKSIASAGKDDLVYMDPPWQGTSGKKDSRYAYLLDLDELITELDSLNARNVPYMLSFDGTCGDKTYGTELPPSLNLYKAQLHAGRSSQATLLGRDDITIESLYLSPALMDKTKKRQISKDEMQRSLPSLF